MPTESALQALQEVRFPLAVKFFIPIDLSHVRDANEPALGYFTSRKSPARRAYAKLLTKDEARRIAADVAQGRFQADGFRSA